MTSLGKVGEICHQHVQLHVEWKIKDVFSLSKVVDTYYKSPSFYLSDHAFYVQMHSNGQSKHKSEGWIGLYLILRESCPAMKVQYTLGFKTTEGEIKRKFSGISTFSEKDSGFGWAKALEKSQLRRVELTPDDVLTITATLQLVPKSIEGLKHESIGRVREIKSTSVCKELLWEIDDALDLLADMKGFVFSSSPFSFNAYEGSLLWDVRDLYDDQNLHIYGTMDCNIPECLNWSMGVLTNGTKHNTQNWQAKASDCSKLTLCWTGLSRSELLEKKEELLPGGVLTFLVRISTVGLKQGQIGRIQEIKSTSLCKELVWEIDDAIGLLADMKGFAFPSPQFSFNKHEGSLFWDIWKLFDDENLIIYATMHCIIPECLNWSMGVLCADGTKHNTQNWQAKASDCSKLTLCWTGPSQSELLEKKEELLPGGVLTFFVQISTVDTADVSIQVGDGDVGTVIKPGYQSTGGENVLEAIGKLWHSSENSDVVFQVGDVEFKAHRAVLGVRTPVLAAMFQHDTIEKTTGAVTISDCEPAVFEELLHFIYTGAPKELTAENAPALFTVANKYLVAELKAQCLCYIRDSLCVETFCDAVLLALKYGEAGLLELAIEFATKNVRKIIRSVKWQRFVQAHPIKANEILIKALGPE